MERWAKINDLYEVSDMGRVRNRKGQLIVPCDNGLGYSQVWISDGHRKSKRLVHRLVAEAFVRNPGGLPEVDHLNNDRRDCRAVNLEWVSHTENIRRRWERHRAAQVDTSTQLEQVLSLRTD